MAAPIRRPCTERPCTATGKRILAAGADREPERRAVQHDRRDDERPARRDKAAASVATRFRRHRAACGRLGTSTGANWAVGTDAAGQSACATLTAKIVNARPTSVCDRPSGPVRIACKQPDDHADCRRPTTAHATDRGHVAQRQQTDQCAQEKDALDAEIELARPRTQQRAHDAEDERRRERQYGRPERGVLEERGQRRHGAGLYDHRGAIANVPAEQADQQRECHEHAGKGRRRARQCRRFGADRERTDEQPGRDRPERRKPRQHGDGNAGIAEAGMLRAPGIHDQAHARRARRAHPKACRRASSRAQPECRPRVPPRHCRPWRAVRSPRRSDRSWRRSRPRSRRR